MKKDITRLLMAVITTVIVLGVAPGHSVGQGSVFNLSPVVSVRAATIVTEGDSTYFNKGLSRKGYYSSVYYDEISLVTKDTTLPIRAYSSTRENASDERTFITTNSVNVVDAVAFARALGYEDTRYDKVNKIFYTRGLFSYHLITDKYIIPTIDNLSKDIFDLCGVEINGEIYLPLEVLSYVYNVTNDVDKEGYKSVVSWDKIVKDNSDLNFNTFTIDGKDINIFNTKETNLLDIFGKPTKVVYAYYRKEYIYGEDRQSQIKVAVNPRGEIIKIVSSKPNTSYLGVKLGSKISESSLKLNENYTLCYKTPQGNDYLFNLETPLTRSNKSINRVLFSENTDPNRRGYINSIIINVIAE